MIQSLTAHQISELVDGEVISQTGSGLVSWISIDSRNILEPPKTLFVALKGAKFDGHEFIKTVYEEGVRNFLVQKGNIIPNSQTKDCTFIAVDNPHQALQQLAAYERSLFAGPLVSITGSNGKTIVKEWLGQVLGQKYAVAKSPKSYNSQVGVPLSVFGIEQNHQVAIMEAGISKPGEMEKLAAILQPQMGIFTNIGTAHEEGFESMDQKLAEKAMLFDQSEFIIYRKDHEKIHAYLSSKFDEKKLISWSDTAGADYTLSVKKETDRSKILLMKPDLSVFTFSVPFADQASLENIRHVIIAALSLGLEESLIQEGLNHLKAVEMRLTLKPGINDCLIIDDTYNNDLAGLRLALDFMAAQRPKRRKVIILSDMLQVWNVTEVYKEVGNLLTHHQIDFLIGVGEKITSLKDSFEGKAVFFADTETLLLHVSQEDFENDLVLVTGARKFGFEVIVNRLQQRIHGTTLEINLNALTHNYNFYKTQISPTTKVMVMVKAFAYGGGAAEIANHLQQLQADYLAVAYTDEGVALREAGIRLPIMVLNPVQESFIHLEKFDLEPVVYSPEFFQQMGKFCQNRGVLMKIHLDIDTGMHRLGFEEEHIPRLLSMIQSYPQLEIGSIYTHLVGADEVIHRDFSLEQLRSFLNICEIISSSLDYKPLRHALNSAGIVQFSEYQMDMVRLGIGLYGVEVSGKFESHLKSISTLKTTISQIKSVPKGQSIGYSRKGIMEEDGKIATIALGYADGYDRRFSNGKGFVLIHGKTAPVIGNVCMDMTMVNITGIEANEGDEVIIYGPGISLKELSERIGTIPYELLTNISSRVKRVYYLD
ncbi:bifunctional UDP-N-acetylmuramoyl-tripeptide:D-alanyl-D-alanine ligase/alanine racemase [Aquiflexum sp. TKW24L]|uniref:bifunctional UDP-N-acetylmuramoyl-tripeptide:D-alanyl-D-alanine ligase/alanine racemase n=1 Tax=Aquiflexum sp. TKW24L TaxID=2942212 RepID=UPI0020BE3AA1|nr:bifunctional UDP-N-acetylmuramoyl-tripeptide:D-alanyl-D-alanine ligase/alanine racemase [Aquiflexum sp. TKW24L]MCL6260488.1 bifunctional UDP-N-acetylmuramoyl-tripeptide:D-alanyl-D-alanine ligase/alanine racemase [Aquiflexum sp. TKW24L]